LKPCDSGFTQNNFESLNQLIWKITPKIILAGSKIFEITAFFDVGTFNEGISALLLFIHGMVIKLGAKTATGMLKKRMKTAY